MFWCTYDFDNTTCYIPKYELDGEIAGYGSFVDQNVQQHIF